IVDFAAGFASEPSHRPQSGVGPEHLAYVLYTSGSTGQPNGVLIEHHGLCNTIESIIPIMETGPGARAAHVLSFNFDGAVGALFWVICAGGAVYLAPRDPEFLAAGLSELIRREGITHANLVPSILTALPDTELPSLSTLVVGGERCPAELVQRWGSRRRLLN